MTDEQFKVIVNLLKKIEENTQYIDGNTSDTERKSSEIIAELKQIKKTIEG